MDNQTFSQMLMQQTQQQRTVKLRQLRQHVSIDYLPKLGLHGSDEQ